MSPRELFRFDHLSLTNIRHPDDLAGFDNLSDLTYYEALNYADFVHTPALRQLVLSDLPEWPEGWSFAGLPELVDLEIVACGTN